MELSAAEQAEESSVLLTAPLTEDARIPFLRPTAERCGPSGSPAAPERTERLSGRSAGECLKTVSPLCQGRSDRRLKQYKNGWKKPSGNAQHK